MHIFQDQMTKGFLHQYAKLLHILCDAWFEHSYGHRTTLSKRGGGVCTCMGMGAPYQNGGGGALWCTCSYFCPSYQYLKMHCNMGKFCFLSAMCFMSPISGDPFKSKYFARGPSTHKSLTFRLNTAISFWNNLSPFVLLLLLLVKARKVLFWFISFFPFGQGITKLVRNTSFS